LVERRRLELVSQKAGSVEAFPQGLKPDIFLALYGTAQAVPFPRHFQYNFRASGPRHTV